MLININKIDEFANNFNNISLKYAENLKGFDPNKIFVGHMLSIGFNKYFIQNVLSEEEEFNSQSTHLHNFGDLEILLSSNDFYKQKGKILNKKSGQSPVVTPKNSTSRSSALEAHLIKKTVNNSSSGGRDKNPPTGKNLISHKLQVRKKRKK
jgi:hypothetical protein